MPLLPHDRFAIETSLTTEEVHNVLAAAVEPPKLFRSAPGQRPFQGELGVDSFLLTRIIGYRNSFIPRIRGSIAATSNGSIIVGTMALHPFVLCFMIFWFGLLFLFGGIMWAAMLAKGVWQPAALVPIGMLAFGWILTSGGFTFEARKARALLVEMLAPPTAIPRAPASVT